MQDLFSNLKNIPILYVCDMDIFSEIFFVTFRKI
jgi:hypothetical protein